MGETGTIFVDDLWIDSRASAANRWLRMTPGAAILVKSRPQAYAWNDGSGYRIHFLEPIQRLQKEIVIGTIGCWVCVVENPESASGSRSAMADARIGLGEGACCG